MFSDAPEIPIKSSVRTAVFNTMKIAPDRISTVSVWSLRVGTLKSMLLILRAQWLIRCSPMSRWRGSLGRLVEHDTPKHNHSIGADQLRAAAVLARRVERGAARFPTEPKCLPQAMALQWLLGATGADSRLVIAMQREAERSEGADEHAFHAWVEWGDQMLIGLCDPSDYRKVLIFQHQPKGGV